MTEMYEKYVQCVNVSLLYYNDDNDDHVVKESPPKVHVTRNNHPNAHYESHNKRVS